MGTRVLIAEDDAVYGAAAGLSLERWGHEVVAVADGAAAWRHFQEDPCPLVITDWMMPELDGLELVRRIRGRPTDEYSLRHHADRPVPEGGPRGCMEAGASSFISKPFDRNELHRPAASRQRIVQGLETNWPGRIARCVAAQTALSVQEPLLRRGQEVDAAGLEDEACLDRIATGLATLPPVTVEGLLDELRHAREVVARLREHPRDDSAGAPRGRVPPARRHAALAAGPLRLLQGACNPAPARGHVPLEVNESPNAGINRWGKTVLFTTLGLAALASRTGAEIHDGGVDCTNWRRQLRLASASATQAALIPPANDTISEVRAGEEAAAGWTWT